MGINLNAHGYQETKAALPGEFVPLPAGGYLCEIVDAEITKSSKGNDMLVLYVDIGDGDYKDYFKAAADRAKNFNSEAKWDNSGVYRSVIFTQDGKVAPFFKGLMGVIEKSNGNYHPNFDDFEPAELKGKVLGVIFGEEEYEKKNGDIGTKTVAKWVSDVYKILEGKYNVPKKKTLDRPPDKINVGKDATKPVDDEDPPF